MKQYKVTGMMCAACSARVEKAVSSLEGVESCSVNLLAGTLAVEAQVDEREIISAVKKAGYGISPKKDGEIKKDGEELLRSKRVLYRLIASVAVILPLMYISMGHVMLGAPMPSLLGENPKVLALIEMLLSGAVLVINKRFFISGAKGIINRAPNMDTLVSLGSGISYLYSIVVIIGVFSAKTDTEALHLMHGLYFESAAMILTLITVGKMLEERAKGKTNSAVSALMDLSPKVVTLLRNGEEVTVPAEDARVGEIFIVREGGACALDGIVVEGECSMDEAALTGESVPKDKKVGDTVYAATGCTQGYIKCQSTSTVTETKFSAVLRLVEEAGATKAPISKVADRVSGIFVPLIMGISLLTFIIQLLVSGEVGFAVARAIAVLVISCPCALGLATPVAIMVSGGVGAKLGLLYKTAESIELTGRATTVIFDKTGTVTEGAPKVCEVVLADGFEEEKLLTLAYSAEEKSPHPQARAIVEYAKDKAPKLEAEEFENLIGNGVKARIMQTNVYGGKLEFIKTVASVDKKLEEKSEELSRLGMTPIFFAEGDKCIGIIATMDTPRQDSRDAVLRLKEMGLYTVMLTGDNSLVAKAVGEAIGFDEIISDVLPDEKAKTVEKFRSRGRVIMVGDGINDAPALTSADVGMAIGGGTDVAIDSADVVLVKSSLYDVYLAVKLGRRALKSINENLFFAFFYNLIGIPLAAGLFGFALPPMFGALAMSFSSLSVVSNALRINSFYTKNKSK